METKRIRLNLRTTKHQEYRDDWDGGKIKICEYKGRCVVCNRTTYRFSDGSGDPRGPLGLQAASEFSAAEYDMVGPDVPCCFGCANVRERYELGLEAARKRWRTPEDAQPAYVQHLRAPNDYNGNPRRVYVVYNRAGDVVDAIDEGYRGLPQSLRGVAGLPSIEVAPSVYREFLKMGQAVPR